MDDREERPTILVVDNEETIQSALATLLGRAGFIVLLVTNGPEVI